MLDRSSLENNKNDLMVSVTKSIVGIVPIAGSLLSELVGNLIPNQRIDRLTKYMIELDKKLSEVPVEKINSLLNNDEFIDLIEEGFTQASRTITDERRLYISSIVSSGITDVSIDLSESKYLLKILSELSDIEIIWLRSFLVMGEDEEFREKQKNILKTIDIYIGADEETLTKASLQISYKLHLERLELIEHKIRIDKKTKIPEYDSFSGKPKKSYTTITNLGRLLLKQIGLIDNISQR